MSKSKQYYAAPKQGSLALMGEITPRHIDIKASEISACNTVQAAYRLCISKNSYGLSQDAVAERLKITAGDFNVIVNNDHYVARAKVKDMPPRRRNINSQTECDLEMICGVDVIEAWRHMYKNRLLNCQRTTADREAELLAELAKLRGVA